MSKKTEWEEKFDVLVNGCEVIHVSDTKQYADIKAFISNLLAKEKMELVKQFELLLRRGTSHSGDLLGATHEELVIYDRLHKALEALKSEEKEEVGK